MLQRFEKTQKHINGNLSKHTNNVKYVQYTASKDMCVCVSRVNKAFPYVERHKHIFTYVSYIHLYPELHTKKTPPNKPNHQQKIASSKPLI